jgi:nitrogen fixation-related uncharacterized protein
MSVHDLTIMVVVGGIFLILGIIGFIWSRIEEGGYYDTISEHIDVREFLDRSPGRIEPEALIIGGKLCMAVGIVILLVSLGFYLWGMAPPTP